MMEPHREGPLDSDAARNLEAFWNDIVITGREHDPDFWSTTRVAEMFEFLYLGGYHNARAGLSVQAEKLLAVGALFVRAGMDMPEEMRDLVEQAINYELADGRLVQRADPVARRQALLELLTAIGGTVQPIVDATDAVIEETPIIEAFMEHIEAWVKLFNFEMSYRDEPKVAYPPYLVHMRTECFGGLRVPDHDEWKRSLRARLSVLVLFVSEVLHLPTPETLQLIASVDALQHPSGKQYAWWIQN